MELCVSSVSRGDIGSETTDHQKSGRYTKEEAGHMQLWLEAGQVTPLGPAPISIFGQLGQPNNRFARPTPRYPAFLFGLGPHCPPPVLNYRYQDIRFWYTRKSLLFTSSYGLTFGNNMVVLPETTEWTCDIRADYRVRITRN